MSKYIDNSWAVGDGYQVGDGYGYPDSTTQSGIDFIQQSQDMIMDQQNRLDTAKQISTDLAQQTGLNYAQVGLLPSSVNVANGMSLPNLSMSDGSLAGSVGTALGAASSAYNNASTDTTGSVLSGAASGAIAGTQIMPGIGTVVGGVIGGLIGLFGSKSKKAAEKKAFQQQEQLAIAPQQQAQANYLQKEGLLQKAIGNYAQYYNPQGTASTFTNKLTGNAPGQSSKFAMAPSTGTMPNFDVAPSNVATGAVTPTSTKPIPQIGGLVAPPQGTPTAPPPVAQLGKPQAPGYTGDPAKDAANLNAYRTQYTNYLNQTNQAAQTAAFSPYSAFGGG